MLYFSSHSLSCKCGLHNPFIFYRYAELGFARLPFSKTKSSSKRVSDCPFSGRAAWIETVDQHPSTFSTRTLLVALRLNDSTNPSQPSYNETIVKLFRALTGTYTLHYIFPGLNGNLLALSSDTACPQAVAGHQTLFSPAWSLAEDDGLTSKTTDALNQITYDRQKELGEFVVDYPNYISPGNPGSRVWGDHLQRLFQIKEKYDPLCSIH